MTSALDYREFLDEKALVAVPTGLDDERHICPLQLEVIRRAVQLWSNPGDLVLSPFMGIGSEGYVAREEGRRFVGVELKRSYWKQACANLAAAAHGSASADLFSSLSPVRGEP